MWVTSEPLLRPGSAARPTDSDVLDKHGEERSNLGLLERKHIYMMRNLAKAASGF